MRFILFLILLAGIGGAVYPWIARELGGGGELGSVRVFAAADGFQPATVHLSKADGPVAVLVELTVPRPIDGSAGQAVLTLTVAREGKTVLARPLDFAAAGPREASPQLQERVYREEAGTISPVEDGDYIFTVGPGDADGVDIGSVDVLLHSGRLPVDPRIQPAGFALIAIGFVGLVLSFQRGGPRNPNSQPPGPRWGRGGADQS
jgi:hypothetical protein